MQEGNGNALKKLENDMQLTAQRMKLQKERGISKRNVKKTPKINLTLPRMGENNLVVPSKLPRTPSTKPGTTTPSRLKMNRLLRRPVGYTWNK